MKRRIFAALLACATILSLAACGGKPGDASSNQGSSSSGNPGASSSLPGGSSSDGSGSDSSQPDASNPDTSNPDASQPGAPDSSAPGDTSQPDSKPHYTLNKNDVTLKKAGASFQLRFSAEPEIEGATVTFTSDKPEIASVDENGTVTAVAPGTATITVAYDKEIFYCVVRCRWEESSGSSSSSGSSGSSSSGGSSSSSSSSKVDLQAFYDATLGKYDFSFMMEADSTTLDSFFSGLSSLSLSQQVIYLCGMNPSPVGDFALVQVSDSKDVDTVKSIFQARIDYMVGDGNGPGGAWYPGPTEMWENESRIVSNGNYVMLIVHEKCDDIASEFNALF